jgi:hypothetical protein
MDVRELYADDEEALRSAVAGILKHHQTAFISILSQDSDGHTATTMPAVKRRDVDQTGKVTFNDHPLVPDQVLHFIGGGGVTLTTALKAGDEVLSVVASRPYGGWKQQGGTASPEAPRVQSMSDAVALSGVRSDPRKLQQVSTSTAQLRSDDGHHTVDHDPAGGTTIKSVDPSTPPASANFSPFASATKYLSHIVQGAKGLIGSAVDGAVSHTHGVDHGQGAWMSAFTSAGSNFVRAHPVLGSILSALDGKHSVTAGLGGVAIQSATSISLACPPGGLGLPSGSITSGSMAPGAASSNVGALAGDLSGTLPNPQVIGILHVTGADKLPRAGSDAAAAALIPPVGIGCPYLNTTSMSGVSLLCIRTV